MYRAEIISAGSSKNSVIRLESALGAKGRNDFRYYTLVLRQVRLSNRVGSVRMERCPKALGPIS